MEELLESMEQRDCGDPDAPAWGLPAPALSVAGLLTLALALHAAALPPALLLMRGGLALSGYALVTTAAGWGVGANIVAAWILTIPAAATISWVAFAVMRTARLG